MFTLDINYKKQFKIYLILTAVTLILGIIYEHFSHNVYSLYMTCAFLIPLLAGFIGRLVLFKKQNVLENDLYHCSIFTLTIGLIITGVVEIYGTTNSLISFYFVVGLVFMILSIILTIMRNFYIKSKISLDVEKSK